VAASDDFGLSDLDLHWQVNDGQEQFRTLLKGIRGNGVEHDDLFDLTTAGLIPGDRVLYWVTVLDNSPPPNAARAGTTCCACPPSRRSISRLSRRSATPAKTCNKRWSRAARLSEDFEEKAPRGDMKQEQTDWADRDELER
jgi:hypothetical protein